MSIHWRRYAKALTEFQEFDSKDFREILKSLGEEIMISQ